MSVVIETTIGDITIDLFLEERPKACINFLKLCKIKYYNYNLFHNIERDFIAQTGDQSGAGDAGESVFGIINGKKNRFFEAESLPKIRHSVPGLLSMVSVGKNLISSQFFFTLGEDLKSLDGVHCVIGEVVEGHDVLRKLNEAIVDEKFRPLQDIRITHTVILEDPFDDPQNLKIPSRSPSPSAERLKNGRIGADEDMHDNKTSEELQEMIAERETKARATILEIVGDLPDADIAPPENVLFVCKLNSVTTDDDLEIIFSRFGKVKGCEVIRDKITGDSLQYAFVEFEDKKSCEAAYFKMDNVLIDDRRIHVDFSQSVAKVQWRGKGRGLIHKDGEQNRKIDFNNYKKGEGRGKYFDKSYNRNDTHHRNFSQRNESEPFRKSSHYGKPEYRRESYRKDSNERRERDYHDRKQREYDDRKRERYNRRSRSRSRSIENRGKRSENNNKREKYSSDHKKSKKPEKKKHRKRSASDSSSSPDRHTKKKHKKHKKRSNKSSSSD